jgi:glycolate oxidase FAD binding subunit
VNDATEILSLSESIAPSSQDAAAEAVRQAWHNDTPVYPIGGGTKLGYGLRSDAPGIGLSLGGLDRVVDHPARDLTITVEAGVTIAALAKRLAAEGQQLPVDVPSPDRATVGGAVAFGGGGPRQFRWGTMRDYVIGLRAVDGSGSIFGAGGRVVKNAAGYDLCRLLTGSFGTLGVIVQVTLMVKPRPETSAFVACEIEPGAAEDLLARMIQTRAVPSAIELLIGPAWQQDPSLGPANRPGAARLVVGLEGSSAEVPWSIAQLQEEWRQAGVAAPTVVSGDQAAPLWDRLAAFSFDTTATNGNAPLVVRIHVLPGAVVPMIRSLMELDAGVSIQSHAASGVIVARLSAQSGDAVRLVDQRLRPAVQAAGGHMVVLARPQGIELSRQAAFGPDPPGWGVMQSIKNRFDPKGILNRGRFPFSIPSR